MKERARPRKTDNGGKTNSKEFSRIKERFFRLKKKERIRTIF